MKFNFPEIDPGRDHPIRHYVNKVREETVEFNQETDSVKEAIEVLDILHAAETLVRKYFKHHDKMDPDKLVTQVIAKNRARGYY